MLAVLGLWAGALAVNRSLREVEGESMLPALRPGDRVVVLPVPPGRVRAGDVVVVRDPRASARTAVKRVTARVGGDLVVLGDNRAASTDSRTYGPVPADLYVGKVVWRLRPWGRVG